MFAGEMDAPAQKVLKYVYIKMLRAQFDPREGKLRKGDILVVDEAKAMRWVYRAKIAKPSSEQEFTEFSRRHARSMGGSRLRRQPLALPAEGESPFEYVEAGTPEHDVLDTDNQNFGEPESADDQARGSNLGDQLENADVADEDDDDDETHDRDYDPNAPVQGNYTSRISSGPGDTTEGPTPKPAGRRARSRG